MDKAAPDPLQMVRDRIDTIDKELHRLLIDRSHAVAEVARLKGGPAPAIAFRPDREADIMRRLALRHEGGLPLTAVEHIWREIISAFTTMQAPFGIVAGPAHDADAMRDLVRFYFGFSAIIETAETSEAAVKRIAASKTDIAVVAADSPGRWWSGLTGADAPKIFARLPFIEMPDRPANLPAFVIGPTIKATSEPDISVHAVKHAAGLDEAAQAVGGAVLARAGGEALIAVPVASRLADVAGESVSAAAVGGYQQPIRAVSKRAA